MITLPKADINSTAPSCQSHVVFNYFLSGDSKQDSDTTTSHSKRLISLLKGVKILTTSLSKIWENTDDCDKQYICASAIYLMSLISQCYSIRFGRGISAPGQVKEVVDRLNVVDKRYIYI